MDGDIRPHLSPPVPAAGIGLKQQHWFELLDRCPAVGFLEIHAENFMGADGLPHRVLTQIRETWPISIHGVGMSLGGADEPDAAHMARLRSLCDRYEPALVSEHLAWCSHGGVFLNDLLPLTYDAATLDRVWRNLDRLQATLRRQVLIENPSTYVGFAADAMDEVAFIEALAQRTGCALLLDVNNVHVSSVNRGFDAAAYIDAFPTHLVREIHLAGFFPDQDEDGRPLLIDTHGAPVADAVWSLYARAVQGAGSVPTLIEWDNDIPPLDTLLGEAARAEAVMLRVRGAGVMA